MGNLKDTPNIGKTLEQILSNIGIDSREKLMEIGSKEAFARIKSVDSSACYNMLCALEGAVQGIRWHGLDEKTKQELKEYFKSFK